MSGDGDRAGGGIAGRLPAGTPDELRAFASCTRDDLELTGGPAPWLPVPGADPDEVVVHVAPGADDPATAEITVAGGWLNLTLVVAVRDGRLVVEEGLPPGGGAWLDDFNDGLRANGMELEDLRAQGRTVRLRKRPIAVAPAPAAAVAPAAAPEGPADAADPAAEPMPDDVLEDMGFTPQRVAQRMLRGHRAGFWRRRVLWFGGVATVLLLGTYASLEALGRGSAPSPDPADARTEQEETPPADDTDAQFDVNEVDLRVGFRMDLAELVLGYAPDEGEVPEESIPELGEAVLYQYRKEVHVAFTGPDGWLSGIEGVGSYWRYPTEGQLGNSLGVQVPFDYDMATLPVEDRPSAVVAYHEGGERADPGDLARTPELLCVGDDADVVVVNTHLPTDLTVDTFRVDVGFEAFDDHFAYLQGAPDDVPTFDWPGLAEIPEPDGAAGLSFGGDLSLCRY